MKDGPKISRFKGLNNVGDPLSLGLGWLSKADNVDITESGKIVRRDGYEQVVAGAMTGAYATRDYRRMYVVDGGDLKSVNADLSLNTLRSGLSDAPMSWTEVNDQVFYSNGVDKGIIESDGTLLDWSWEVPGMPSVIAGSGVLPAGSYQVACTFLLPDGRETGSGAAALVVVPENSSLIIDNIPQVAGCMTAIYIAPANSTVFQHALDTVATAVNWNTSSDELGMELLNPQLAPPPLEATITAHWKGRLYLMQYLPSEDVTVIWMSEPLGYHLFDLKRGFISVPGKGVLLADAKDALIIGTESKIHSFDGEKLVDLAGYGAVAGQNVSYEDDGSIYFWSTRGVCSALPFSNLTLNKISVDSGVSAAAAIIQVNGAKKYVVAVKSGGEIFNKRG